MSKFINEFRKFALRGNAIELAIGVVVGAAFNGIITSLVNNIITPPLGLLVGNIDFSSFEIPLKGDAVLQYGLFIQSVISFLITAVALFLVVKGLNTLTRRNKKEEKAKATKELLVLEEIRDLLKKK